MVLSFCFFKICHRSRSCLLTLFRYVLFTQAPPIITKDEGPSDEFVDLVDIFVSAVSYVQFIISHIKNVRNNTGIFLFWNIVYLVSLCRQPTTALAIYSAFKKKYMFDTDM